MDILNPKRLFKKDIEKIKKISETIDKRLSKATISEEEKIKGMTIEELQDLSKIVKLADFMMQKYEDKKETRSILTEFVTMIKESAESIEGMDDEISELILSAEDSIKRVKDTRSKINSQSGLDRDEDTIHVERILAETCSINLTKIATEINAVGYQPISQEISE